MKPATIWLTRFRRATLQTKIVFIACASTTVALVAAQPILRTHQAQADEQTFSRKPTP